MSSLSYECYRLEPENWSSNCLSNFDELRRQQKLFDISVKVDDKSFMAHRVVLSAYIPQIEIEIKDSLNTIDASAMESLIDFVYTGRIVITTSNVQSLLKGASFLELGVVRNACCQYLKISLHADNVFGIKSLATTHDCHKLVEASKKFIQLNFKVVSKSDDFLSIDFCEIIDIVSKDELNVSGEEDVFYAVMAWIKSDVEEKESKLPELLTKVRLPLLSSKFLNNYVLKEELIQSSDLCRDLVEEAKDYRLIPDKLQSLSTLSRYIDIQGLIYAFKTLAFNESINKFEVFDPQFESWQMSESNKKCRDDFTLSVLNNKIYSIGGYHFELNTTITSVEVFDPKNKSWTDVSPINCKQGSVECYSLEKNEWTTIEFMSTKRTGVGVVACEGQLYALGGVNGNLTLNLVEMFDPQNSKWISMPPMLTKRHNFGIATLRGKIYACGGCVGKTQLITAQVFDPNTQKWESITPMNEFRDNFSLVANCGQLYAIGGYLNRRDTNTIDVYDPVKDCWNTSTSLVSLEGYMAAAVVPN